jgi:hypothetical protein
MYHYGSYGWTNLELKYSSSLVDFQLLYEHILKNWPYERNIFTHPLASRLHISQ